MTKKEIDNYVTHNYSWLLKIAKSHIYKNSRKFSAEELITNLYEYLIKKKNEIPDSQNLEIFSSRFIVTQCAWNNSETNKDLFLERYTQGKIIDNAVIPDKHLDDDISDKIELEMWYSSKQYILKSFRSTIKEKEEQIFFDVYFSRLKKGEKVTVRAMAKHFNISSTPTYHLIKEMHNKLNEYGKILEQNQKT